MEHGLTMQQVDKVPTLKVSVVGGEDSGKTTMLIRYLTGYWTAAKCPTNEGPNQKFMPSVTRGCDGLMVMYAINSCKSFEQATKLVEEIIRTVDGDPVAVVVVGNKMDLSKERVVTKEEGANLAHKNSLRFIKVSIKTEENVNESFEELLDFIVTLRHPTTENTNGEHPHNKKCVVS